MGVASIEWSPFTRLSVDVDGRTPSVWLRLSCFAVFSFFVDFLKILEVPSNVFVAWPVKRIEHAGDPPCSGIWCPYPDDSIQSLKS